MTFKQAKKKLKKIADGQYHSIKYELTEFQDGSQESECNLYIHGGQHNYAATWDLAFSLLEKTQPDPKESP